MGKNKSTSVVSSKRDKPVITPAMLAAGVEALCDADDRFVYMPTSGLEQIVALVFSAMERVGPSAYRESHTHNREAD